MLRNWLIVYLGNLVGALGLVVLVLLSHHLDMNGGRPEPLIPRARVAEVRERLRADGRVDTALDEAGVATSARRLADEGAEGLVISLIHAVNSRYCLANLFLSLMRILSLTCRAVRPSLADATLLSRPCDQCPEPFQPLQSRPVGMLDERHTPQ